MGGLANKYGDWTNNWLLKYDSEIMSRWEGNMSLLYRESFWSSQRKLMGAAFDCEKVHVYTHMGSSLTIPSTFYSSWGGGNFLTLRIGHKNGKPARISRSWFSSNPILSIALSGAIQCFAWHSRESTTVMAWRIPGACPGDCQISSLCSCCQWQQPWQTPLSCHFTPTPTI